MKAYCVFSKIGIAICVGAMVCFLLSGCKTAPEPITQQEPKPVEQVGQTPNDFSEIIENNVFLDVKAFENCLLKSEVLSTDEESHMATYRVWMMDLYGKELASYTCTANDACSVQTMIPTADGGYLFVLGFDDYAYQSGGWASENGFASRVIKCDASGNLQFDTAFSGVYSQGLRFSYEKNGKYYFFGHTETPETDHVGVWNYTDIYMAILNENGQLIQNRLIAGSDFDTLDAAEVEEDGFVLSISSQSDDGDFAGSNSGGYGVDWVFTVDDELQIVSKKMESGRAYSDDRIGIKDGETVYRSNRLFKNFDAGTPKAIIDYGDSYLVVSTNPTGVYENTPLYVSAIWYYYETVYSFYDDQDNLIFRGSVDSTPDYPA